MAVYDYEEAVYGALCYIYGDDDNKITSGEKSGVQSEFLERHFLTNESMEAISYRWSRDIDAFYWDVINSLLECSLTQRLEAYRTICIVKNRFSSNRDDRWTPANRILADLGITVDEYNYYIGR